MNDETTATAAARPPPRAAGAVSVLSTATELQAFLDAYAHGVGLEDCPAPRVSADEWRAREGGAETAAFQRAQRFGLPLIAGATLTPEPRAVDRVPPAIARRFPMVPLREVGGVLAVAVEDPADAELLPALALLTNQRIALMVAEPALIHAAIGESYDRVEDAAVAHQLGLDANSTGTLESSEREARRLAQEQPVVRLVGEIFADARHRRASDIHLRPAEDALELLFRIDNELLPVRRFLRALSPAIVSRIKVLANMNVAEHRLPQDGRATYLPEGGKPIDMRVSILPTIHGESVVIRLLDTMEGLRGIEQLGFTPKDQERFLDLMARSHGMILVCGPTGSGKSTTLYAALNEARKERVNIVTVEDPVEYHISEVQQMQVHRVAGFTFASALRNILRHDPDVIMVGEIRDRETAQIAVESALTGHLLLSTLHTNTAATAITRLLDLGVESFLLRSTLLGVLSQRLARRNCPQCRVPEDASAHQRELLGVGADEVFYKGSGCRNCEGLGVRGRVAVYELMTVTPAVRRLIQPKCEAEGIHDTAVGEGMVPLTQHAIALARAGTISLNEAFRLRSD